MLSCMRLESAACPSASSSLAAAFPRSQQHVPSIPIGCSMPWNGHGSPGLCVSPFGTSSLCSAFGRTGMLSSPIVSS